MIWENPLQIFKVWREVLTLLPYAIATSTNEADLNISSHDHTACRLLQ